MEVVTHHAKKQGDITPQNRVRAVESPEVD